MKSAAIVTGSSVSPIWPRHLSDRKGAVVWPLLLLIVLSFLMHALPASAAEGEAIDIDRRIRELAAGGVAVGEPRKGGIVLVLSGGGTKGFAHVGVLKVLEEQGIPVVGIVGTSIGSVIGGLYATGYTADELHDIIMETNIMGLLADSGTRIRPGAGNHRPVGESAKLFQKNLNKDFKSAGPLGVLPALSLVNFLTKYTGHIHTTDFEKLPIPFACVATDIGTGETVVLRDGNLSSAIRASVAIPGLLEPWPLDGRLLVDGGLVANLPVAIAKDLFPGYPVVAVNLAGTTIEKSDERFTNMVDILVQTIDVMTVDQLKHNESLADLIIYPDVSGFSMLDASGYDTIFESGLSAAGEKIDEVLALSASAPPPPLEPEPSAGLRIVRNVRVEGMHARAAGDIERSLAGWIDKPYNVEKVNAAMLRISKREEVATVDVDTYPASGGDPDDVDVVFSIEQRSAYQVTLDGYSTNLHPHRWVGFSINARDLASAGDSAYLQASYGNEEWGAALRYFTPLMNNSQWGFAFNARKERYEPDGWSKYSLERYSLRALYYEEGFSSRVGFGIAGENTNAAAQDKSAWGPYLYYQRDTLDNVLIPTKGHAFNSQIWWNSSGIWVSRSDLTAYVPFHKQLHFVIKLGLETGDMEHQAYRVLLGDQEELFSLARHPYVGDQSAWMHVGLGNTFYNSWWGSVRGEIFAAYGMIMEDWEKTNDAWEVGVALSIPGQLLNGRVLLVFDDDSEFTLGFTLGIPRWWDTPMP